MPVALTPPSPVSPLRRSARLVQDISPTPVKSNPKLNTNLVHPASRKRPRAPGHSIIMANSELPTPRNNKLTHSPSRKRREPPTDSIIMANLELPTPRMLRAEKRRRLSTPPTPPTPVRTPIPTRKRKAFSPSPLAEYTCDGDLPSPVSMNKKRKENSGVACVVTPTKPTRTSVVKGEVLSQTPERRHTRRSSLLAGVDASTLSTPPPPKRKRKRPTTARASGSRLPTPPSPSLPQEPDPFSVSVPIEAPGQTSSTSTPPSVSSSPVLTTAASAFSPLPLSVPLRTSPRRVSAQPVEPSSSSFAAHVDATTVKTQSDDVSAPIDGEELPPISERASITSPKSSPVLVEASSSSSSSSLSRPLRTSPRRTFPTGTGNSSFVVHVDASPVATTPGEERGGASVPINAEEPGSSAEAASASPPTFSAPTRVPTPLNSKEEPDISGSSSTVQADVSSPLSRPLRTSPYRVAAQPDGSAKSRPAASSDSSPFVVATSALETSDMEEHVDGPLRNVDASPDLAPPASTSILTSPLTPSMPLRSPTPPLRSSPRRTSIGRAGPSSSSFAVNVDAGPGATSIAVAPVVTMSDVEHASAAPTDASSSRSSPSPSHPSPRRPSLTETPKPRPSTSFTMHVDTSPAPTLDNVEQDDTWPEPPASTSASTSPPTSPSLIRSPTPLRTKVVVHIPSVVVTPPTPPPLASGAVDAPIPLSDEPVPRPHNPPPQLKIQIPDSEEQMPMVSDSVVPAIIMPPLPPLPAMSPPPQPMQMNMNVVVNVPPPPLQVDLNGGVWKTACKTRVWELQRRYSPLTIRDLVAQEADDYFLRFGYPKVWNVSREAEGGDGEEEGEDWSEYESELSSDDEEEWGAKRRDDRDGDVDMDGEEDAEGEIDPDAWHDPSFSVQGETVGVEGGGGMMTAFYVPPSPVYDGGAEESEEEEVQDVDMDMSPDVQELPQSQQPLSPVQSQSPEWSPSSPSTSPFQRISRQRQYAMYENTLPVPPPRLATIPVHALRHMEIGPRVLVGRGTPVDRARAAQWASGVCRVDEGSRGRTLSRERRGGGAGEDRDRERSGSLTPPPTFEEDPNTWDAFFESLKRGEGEASTSASVPGSAGSGGGSGSGGGMMMDLDVSLGGHTMQDSFGGSSINVNLPSALDLAPLSPLGSLSPPLSSSPPPSPSSSQCLTVGSDFLGMGIGMGMGVNMNMNLGMGMMGMGGMMGDPLNGGSGMGGVMSGGGGDLGMGMGMGMFGMGFGVGMGIGMAVGMGAGAGWLPPVPVGVNGVECPPPQLQGGAGVGVGVVGIGGEGFEQGTSTLSFALG